jgi:MFS family permease
VRFPFVTGLAAFAVFGALFGVWQVLLADLTRDLRLSPGPLGVALSVGFVASLPAMLVAGRVADRIGARRLGVGAGLLLAAALAAFAVVGTYPLLVAVLLVFLAASGMYDVAINAFAIGLEQETQRKVLLVLHAAFSGGGAAGALATGVLVSVGLDFRMLYLAVGVLVALVVLAWGAAPSPGVRPKQGEVTAGSLYRHPLLLLLAAIAALTFLSEGAMESWSAIYLRSSLELPALVGAAGVAVFHAAMMTGRLATAAVVHRLGRVPTMRAAGLAVVIGMALALATEEPPVILAGFLVVGLALAGVVPVVFSLAGDAAPGRSGGASSVITTIGYAGFLVGPGLIGAVAELTSLRLALATIVATGLSISLLAGVAGGRR